MAIEGDALTVILILGDTSIEHDNGDEFKGKICDADEYTCIQHLQR